MIWAHTQSVTGSHPTMFITVRIVCISLTGAEGAPGSEAAVDPAEGGAAGEGGGSSSISGAGTERASEDQRLHQTKTAAAQS